MLDRDDYLRELARVSAQINERVDDETRELVGQLVALLAQHHGCDGQPRSPRPVHPRRPSGDSRRRDEIAERSTLEAGRRDAGGRGRGQGEPRADRPRPPRRHRAD